MRNYSGFSMIELMLTIVLIGILSTFTFNSFISISSNTRLEKTAWNVQKDLSGLRPVAIKNDCPVLVRFPSLTQYKVYVDMNKDGATQNSELVNTFNLPYGITFGLSSISPGAAPAGAVLPVSGGEGSQWDSGINLQKDAIGTINSGSVYLSCTQLKKVCYCIAVVNNSQKLKMFRWNGSSWAAL